MPNTVRRLMIAMVLAIVATAQVPQSNRLSSWLPPALTGNGGAETLTASVSATGASAGKARRLIPGGQSVGVAMNTAGVVVIGTSDLGKLPSPIRKAGIQNGDIIRRVNGVEVNSSEALSGMIRSSEAVELEVEREGRTVTCAVQPALDSRDGRWRLGAWVRDSTAGVGTLTYYDPETGNYGALGHAITDADTRVTMPLSAGALYKNRVMDVTPSQRGKPGELTGDFVFDGSTIGTVEKNTVHGIFGEMDGAVTNALYPLGLPTATRGEIHTGAATILATVDESGPREYSCEIVRVNDRAVGARAMVLKITDTGLLDKTGGIVQGMSGSPILQDGRLIGAVTHVMVNDPAMGYGISIEEMLKEGDGLCHSEKQENEAAA